TSADDLAGLPESFCNQAAALATKHGLSGQWAIGNNRSACVPFLTLSTRRDLREKVWHMFKHRGDNGDVNDNKAIASEILKLRSE
ncbi:hypothetical protein ABTD18_19945, partial [Acinetobacter baumannii]